MTSPFFDALPNIELYEEPFNTVKISGPIVGRAFVLDLPVELLLDILQYCKFSDVHSLMRANKRLHAVSIRRFYSLIPLNLRHFRYATLPKVSENMGLEEIIASLKDEESKILRGLFARKEHILALRTFIICGIPQWSRDDYRTRFANVIIRAVVQQATALQKLYFKQSAWNAHPAENYLSFEGVTFPESLSSLYIPLLSEKTSLLLACMSSLTVLHISEQCDVRFLRQIPLEIGKQILELRCEWYMDIGEGGLTCASFSQQLGTLLPNLQRLAIGYSITDADRNIWRASMSPEIMDGYLILLRFLQRLTELTILRFSVSKDDDDPPLQFSSARPTLLRLMFDDYVSRDVLGASYVKKLLWKKDNGVGRDGMLWTPDPTVSALWPYWFRQFGHTEEVSRMMSKLWRMERNAPSLDRLRMWESANLMSHVDMGTIGYE